MRYEFDDDAVQQADKLGSRNRKMQYAVVESAHDDCLFTGGQWEVTG
jgi:hypothetical protein